MKNLTHYSDIDSIKYDARQNGSHFFDPSAMRFFNSRILPTVYGGRFFITSERFDDATPRAYTVRECLNGEIRDVSSFQEFASRSAAVAFIRKVVSA
jgi:hypothetical protein